jgi:hypothetical protein
MHRASTHVNICCVFQVDLYDNYLSLGLQLINFDVTLEQAGLRMDQEVTWLTHSTFY